MRPLDRGTELTLSQLATASAGAALAAVRAQARALEAPLVGGR